jgi:hypothetical protein
LIWNHTNSFGLYLAPARSYSHSLREVSLGRKGLNKGSGSYSCNSTSGYNRRDTSWSCKLRKKISSQ